MKLEDRFELDAPIERVWDILNDVELISPYVPGFTLEESDGDVFRGTMKVKLGAVTVKYKSEIAVTERDHDNHAVVLDVSGKEQRGTGRMKAVVTSRLQPAGEGTGVTLETDLRLAGKIAQMGRGMIADVSNKLIGDFVLALDENVLSEAAPPTASNGAGGPPPDPVQQTASRAAHPDADAVDLTGAAGAALARRVGPPALAFATLLVLWLLWRR